MKPTENRALAEQRALREKLRPYGARLRMREAIASVRLSGADDVMDVEVKVGQMWRPRVRQIPAMIIGTTRNGVWFRRYPELDRKWMSTADLLELWELVDADG